MADVATELTRTEYRLARRLTRLFRIERHGRLERRPGDVAERFIARRGELVDELMRLEGRRRSLTPWPLPELDLAFATLAREVGSGEQWCHERLATLGAELDRRRGVGTATGLRDSGAGQLLGRG
jgi:hypothetical protein